MTLHVSGTCDGAYLVVERVHRRNPPADAVRVLRYPEPGYRKPRAGDRLDYRANYGAPFVFAPKRAKGGATPSGRGLRVYLPAEEATQLRAMAKAEGCKPSEIVSRLVREHHAARIHAAVEARAGVLRELE